MTFQVETDKKIRRIIPLDSRVLIVGSVTKEVGDWSAYIGAVSGINHKTEWEFVMDYGTKVLYELAKILFPDFDKKYIWRD